MDLPEPMEDIDLTLRHVTRLFPEELARALLPAGAEVSSASWLDTQVTARQRRLDRALEVVVNGERQLFHNEWQLEMEAGVPFRVFEYHVLLALTLAGEATAPLKAPPIESVVVLLSGREAPWPAEAEYRTSPADAPFCGVRFRIEAVYQRTVAELLARKSVLWLIFAPLACDATPEAMASVVERLRAETEPRAFEELAVALTVMADADKRQRGLRSAIVSLFNEEIIMQSWVYKQGHEKGLEKGLEKGRDEGRDEGLKKGRDEGRVVEARSALRRVLARRNLPLSPEDNARIEACSELDTLARWLDGAILARTAAEALVPSATRDASPLSRE